MDKCDNTSRNCFIGHRRLISEGLTKTRYAHQATALALAKLPRDGYQYTKEAYSTKDEDECRLEMVEKSPALQYWDMVINMELTALIFIRSHLEENFPLYVESLKALVPWFFAPDHHNYARWIPIHIRDMECLPESILIKFKEYSHWSNHKTTNRFSAIPVYQAHEQNNEAVKGAVGAVGLTENLQPSGNICRKFPFCLGLARSKGSSSPTQHGILWAWWSLMFLHMAPYGHSLSADGSSFCRWLA